jgi:hypothetical protein
MQRGGATRPLQFLLFELTRERRSYCRIGKAPPDDASTMLAPVPLPALGLNAVARVEVVHGVEPRA